MSRLQLLQFRRDNAALMFHGFAWLLIASIFWMCGEAPTGVVVSLCFWQAFLALLHCWCLFRLRRLS